MYQDDEKLTKPIISNVTTIEELKNFSTSIEKYQPQSSSIPVRYNREIIPNKKSFLHNNSNIINIDVRGVSDIKKGSKTIGGALDRFLEDVTEITNPFIEKYSPIINNLTELSKGYNSQHYTNPLEKRRNNLSGWMNIEDLIKSQMKEKNHFTQPPQMNLGGAFPMFAEMFIKNLGTLEHGAPNRLERGKMVKTITPFGEMHMISISGKYLTE
jgi:hypothetical protein